MIHQPAAPHLALFEMWGLLGCVGCPILVAFCATGWAFLPVPSSADEML
jgi:hypothetical protein